VQVIVFSVLNAGLSINRRKTFRIFADHVLTCVLFPGLTSQVYLNWCLSSHCAESRAHVDVQSILIS